VLTRIVLWWSAFTTLTGFASNVWMLFADPLSVRRRRGGRLSQRDGQYFAVVSGGGESRAQGIVWMASRVGGAISPLMVVPIQIKYGWRASFYVFGILGVVWASAWYWWYRDRPAEKPA
jgi:hypothetical protein